ncbi:MAG: secondary thiamine-phosphate synthase enzyme YjbQ [Candidatus Nanoarchaeia archaeon]|nr:secondary thiamine-phosphate synthase enzyme YjbQ [Candidatus Nanoarchaeia archaeon]
MKKEIILSTKEHEEIVDITDEVQKIVSESKVKNGLCNVFTMHATAAIIINENYDSNLRSDIIKAIKKIVPEKDSYLHDKIDNNAASHIRSTILGPSETIPIKDGKLQLGTWQQIAFFELDGPRNERKIVVSVIKDS